MKFIGLMPFYILITPSLDAYMNEYTIFWTAIPMNPQRLDKFKLFLSFFRSKLIKYPIT